MSPENRARFLSELPLAKRNKLFKSREMDDKEFEERLQEARKILRKWIPRIKEALSEDGDQE